MHRSKTGLVVLLGAALAALGLAVWGGERVAAREAPTGPVHGKTKLGLEGQEHPLPLPSKHTLLEYEKLLYPFILSRDYANELGWIHDKSVRDTGPYVKGQYYGTHPAVRIYYSPKVMYWLTGNPEYWPEGKASGKAIPKTPRTGEIPDGGMIVKEMFQPPAARYDDMKHDDVTKTLFDKTSPGWTVMVKDEAGAPDGWFWASVWVGQHYDTPQSLNYQHSGFGLACVRCHAVATEKGTFSALRNIVGFPGDPLTFFVDETWRKIPRELQPYNFTHSPGVPEYQPLSIPGPCVPNPAFIRIFDTCKKYSIEDVKMFPSESNDHVTNDPNNPLQYLTSDQCMMCHSGANSKFAFGPIMFLETDRGGLNVSPYGEWRWSPMGLAGRDPVFHAQLESELSLLKEELPAETAEFFGHQVVNTCLRCHGAMGKRSYDHDQGVGDAYWDEKARFELDWYYIADEKNPLNKYASLARDGISCMICHRMTEEYPNIGDFLANSITGQFTLGPEDEIYGPFEDVVTLPMENSVGLTPKHNPFMSKSRLCASCHIISLPVVDWPLDNPPGDDHMTDEEVQQLLASEKNPNLKGFLHRIEQATYLEWLNSAYQDEFGEKTETAQSCQDCHMPTGYESPDGKVKVDPIITKIATIEDEQYPEADYRLPLEDITVKTREEGYRRHTFQGLNLFLTEMFRQFHDVLGVRTVDFETEAKGLDFAVENYVENARKKSAAIEILDVKTKDNMLEAKVRVTNKTGHRLPSGVGFRRLFIEFTVFDNSRGRERAIWTSGGTNSVGVLVDWDGNILPEEFFTEVERDGKMVQSYHPHHNVISRMNQVQVYEELATNAKGRLTTSFIHRANHLKENRLLPLGWKKEGPSPEMPSAFVKATHPGHETEHDAEYWNGSGTDELIYRVTLPKGFDASKMKARATLYSQSWAPYYLRDRFTAIPAGKDGEARRRLFYLASHLDTEGTPIEDWKFKLVTAEWPAPPVEEKPEAAEASPPEGEDAEDDEEEPAAGKGCG